MPITIGGTTIYKPGAYSQVSIDQQTVISPGTARVLAVVGPFDATALTKNDGIVRFYNDPTTAQTDLKQGDLLTAMQVAWVAHGASTNGQTKPSADVIAAVEVIGTGAAGAILAADWQTALDKLKAYKIDGVIPITGDAAVHGQVKDHVTTMSNTSNRGERRAFVGGLLAEAVGTATTAAGTLMAGRVCRVFGGIKRYINGVLTTLPGYIAAAAVAGVWAGNDPGDPITFDKINVAGLEKTLLPSDIDTLLQAGVICFEAAPKGGFRLIQGLTTAKTELTDESVVDALTVEIRTELEERYVGNRGDNKSISAMQADAAAILEMSKTKRNWLVDDVDNQNVLISPAYTPPIVTRSGTVFTVSFGANVVRPTNFVQIMPRFRLG